MNPTACQSSPETPYASASDAHTQMLKEQACAAPLIEPDTLSHLDGSAALGHVRGGLSFGPMPPGAAPWGGDAIFTPNPPPFGVHPPLSGDPHNPPPFAVCPPLGDPLLARRLACPPLVSTQQATPGKLLAKTQKKLRKLRGSAITAKRTHVIYVLDESYSMLTGKALLMAAYNDQLRLMRSHAALAGELSVSLIRFNGEVRAAKPFDSIEQAHELDDINYTPNGSTALLDAIASAIKTTLKAPGLGEGDTAVLVTIFTDGDENNSRKYPLHGPELAQCIQALEDLGTVSFALLSPSEHQTKLANILRLRRENVGGYDVHSQQGRAHGMASMTAATRSFMSARAAGQTQVMNLYAQEPGDATA